MIRRPPRWILPPIALALGVASCAEVLVDFSETQLRSFEPSDYERVLERWTRSEELYVLDGLDNALTVTATFKSWEYRQAYVTRYAHDFRMTPEERGEMEAAERTGLDAAHEFFVAATSTRVGWSDLGADTSPWQIRLINDRGDVVTPFPDAHDPPGIEAIRRPTPVHHAYFPYLNVFRKVFVLRFPRALPDGRSFLDDGVKSFTLEFAGALGEAQLRWTSTAE